MALCKQVHTGPSRTSKTKKERCAATKKGSAKECPVARDQLSDLVWCVPSPATRGELRSATNAHPPAIWAGISNRSLAAPVIRMLAAGHFPVFGQRGHFVEGTFVCMNYDTGDLRASIDQLAKQGRSGISRNMLLDDA